MESIAFCLKRYLNIETENAVISIYSRDKEFASLCYKNGQIMEGVEAKIEKHRKLQSKSIVLLYAEDVKGDWLPRYVSDFPCCGKAREEESDGVQMVVKISKEREVKSFFLIQDNVKMKLSMPLNEKQMSLKETHFCEKHQIKYRIYNGPPQAVNVSLGPLMRRTQNQTKFYNLLHQFLSEAHYL